jgi:hypothetical protein
VRHASKNIVNPDSSLFWHQGTLYYVLKIIKQTEIAMSRPAGKTAWFGCKKTEVYKLEEKKNYPRGGGKSTDAIWGKVWKREEKKKGKWKTKRKNGEKERKGKEKTKWEVKGENKCKIGREE